MLRKVVYLAGASRDTEYLPWVREVLERAGTLWSHPWWDKVERVGKAFGPSFHHDHTYRANQIAISSAAVDLAAIEHSEGVIFAFNPDTFTVNMWCELFHALHTKRPILFLSPRAFSAEELLKYAFLTYLIHAEKVKFYVTGWRDGLEASREMNKEPDNLGRPIWSERRFCLRDRIDIGCQVV